MIDVWELICHSCDITIVAYDEKTHKKFYKEHADKGHLFSDGVDQISRLKPVSANS